MIITVTICERGPLIPADTSDFSYEAILRYDNRKEVILAIDKADAEIKAMAREAELKAL